MSLSPMVKEGAGDALGREYVVGFVGMEPVVLELEVEFALLAEVDPGEGLLGIVVLEPKSELI